METLFETLLFAVKFFVGTIQPNWERIKASIENLRWQEFVDHYVRERICALVSVLNFPALVSRDVARKETVGRIHFVQKDHNNPR
jgi:hypothetical protein